MELIKNVHALYRDNGRFLVVNRKEATVGFSIFSCWLQFLKVKTRNLGSNNDKTLGTNSDQQVPYLLNKIHFMSFPRL